MMGEKHQCAERVYSGRRSDFGGRQCRTPAIIQEDGKWWCSRHAPSAVRERNDARNAAWASEFATRQAALSRASALQSARDAVVEAAKRRRIESHRYCDATKDADAKTVASPDTMAPLIKACQDLDAATDRLIALEEQA